MEYVLLIYAAESRFADMTPEAGAQVMQAYGSYTRELRTKAKAGDCAALEATGTATTVRVREGKRAVKDGPYAETREQLAGYYSLDAETEEDALAWAAKIPDAKGGTIEVRAVIQMGAPPSAPVVTVDRAANKEYVLLIYEAEETWARMSKESAGAMFTKYRAVTEELKSSGNFLAGAPLTKVATAKSVHVDANGKRVVRDGPFAETREQLAGYYRVLAKDLDEAIALAARIPGAELGVMEVRPVMDTTGYGGPGE